MVFPLECTFSFLEIDVWFKKAYSSPSGYVWASQKPWCTSIVACVHLEIGSIVWVIKRLRGRPRSTGFQIYPDHKVLESIAKAGEHKPRVRCWLSSGEKSSLQSD